MTVQTSPTVVPEIQPNGWCSIEYVICRIDHDRQRSIHAENENGAKTSQTSVHLRIFLQPHFAPNPLTTHTVTMATPVPSIGALRALRQSLRSDVRQTTQVRHATLLRRPKRPYTFTQLVTLSDGSAFTLRTTSPQPVYKSTKDIRNTPLWNPSSRKLLNVEEDEAGKLAAFRAKFGRGWDADAEKVCLGPQTDLGEGSQWESPTDNVNRERIQQIIS